MSAAPAGVRENVSLAQFTTYKLGGPARYFLGTASADELAAGLAWAAGEGLPVFVLGGGSNILVADGGFPGLAVHYLGSGIRIQESEVSVGAGAKVEDLLEQTLAAGLVGLECMAGVPGEVGGAIRGNAGTFGQQIGDYVVDVDVVGAAGERRTVPQAGCGFAYRHSAFKQTGEIILGCRLQLQPGDAAAGRKLVAERLERRWKTQPRECSAGCVFKNFRFEDVDLGALRAAGLDVDRFAEHRKLPAAYVIEAAGLKGRQVGAVQSSPVHANFLVNHGGGTAAQVSQLMSEIQKAVRERYGLEMQEEIQRVGF